MLIDEVLREFSINFVKSSQYFVNKFKGVNTAGFYSYNSVNNFAKNNLINRKFSTKANNFSDNNFKLDVIQDQEQIKINDNLDLNLKQKKNRNI